MRIFALFDDPDAIQKARDELETEGLGDAVVQVVSPHLDREATRPGPVLGTGGQSSTGAVVVNQSGQTAPRGAQATIQGTLGSLRLPEEHREFFRRSLEQMDAQVLVADADDDNERQIMSIIESAGPQHIATS